MLGLLRKGKTKRKTLNKEGYGKGGKARQSGRAKGRKSSGKKKKRKGGRGRKEKKKGKKGEVTGLETQNLYI